ncbi:MAG: FAD-dependent oxidoreductase [Oscillospiraceae bacterium]|jgi:glycerol-3-phosphate dehydrogenase|nr:FAD-dependent oxidoreductase [Oscillospiraceae bacterium]
MTLLNSKLAKEFNGRFKARPERRHTVLEGESADWQEIVAAGYLAAKYNKTEGVVNDIRYLGRVQPVRLPELNDDALEGAAPDVLVVGGGVVGCAIARELTRWKLDVLLIEKECDVALHASSRNDGEVHPGLDLHKGSQKYIYNMRGNEMYDQICADLQVPFERPGQWLAFPGKIPMIALRLTKLYWNYLGIPCKVLHRAQAPRRLAGLHPNLKHLLAFPTAGAVCPYGLTIAYAENAIQNGARVSLQTACLSIEVKDGQVVSVKTNRGTIRPKIVVNAAGTFADNIAAMADDRFFSIHPRRGTNSILDKKATNLISRVHVASMMAGGNKINTHAAHSKGGGIILTAHRNLLIGPDAVETPDKEDFSTTPESIATVFNKQARTSDVLNRGQIITYFTGVRAPTYEEKFVIRWGLYTKNIIHAAGIQSPGLTAAPAIGETIARWAAERLSAAPNEQFDPVRPAIVHAAQLPERERNRLIEENPDYGVIFCRCEQISKGEIVAALHRPLPCDSVDGVKRRVRAGMGRCQGGFCGPQVAQTIAEELHIPLSQVRKSGPGSEIVYGSIKEAPPPDSSPVPPLSPASCIPTSGKEALV